MAAVPHDVTVARSAERPARRVGRWLLIAFYAVAGVGHLLVPDMGVKITPAWVPHPYAVVIATGLCELAGAAGLTTMRWRRAAGWALAAYAVCVFPANIKHAVHDLAEPSWGRWAYHVPRLMLQPLIVWWALWASGAVRVRATRRQPRPPFSST